MEPKKAIEQLKDMEKDVRSEDDLEAVRAGIRALEAVEGIRRMAEQEEKTVREAVSAGGSEFEQGILFGTIHMRGLIDCRYADIEEGE